MNLARLDPRVKLLILAGLSTAALVSRSYTTLLALLAISLIILLAGSIAPITIWMKLRGLFSLIVALFVLQCLFNRSGEPLLAFTKFTLITQAGFKTAAAISLRLLVILLAALIVTTGEARDYLLSLTTMKVPYEVAFMVLTALRFLPMMREEAQDVLCAAQLRGLQIKKAGLKRQVGAYSKIIIPIVAGAVRRAEDFSIAMEARGFRAHPQRTTMRKLRMRASDWLYLAVFCAIISSIEAIAAIAAFT
ncbi:MAG: energy-coupling factor transporter transmembrane protein EcfT [Oscillospiraceae bacterium]|nr:energy-coupling factor transporter transmembrane protein EcfT [Oscillospiraceae bacterium]